MDFTAGATALDGLAASTLRPFSVTTGTESFRALGEMVSDNFFGVLGVPLAQGRGFNPGAAETDAVIGHGLWQRRFGGATRRRRPDDPAFGTHLYGRRGGPGGIQRGRARPRVEVWTSLAGQRVLSPGDDMLTNRGRPRLLPVRPPAARV